MRKLTFIIGSVLLVVLSINAYAQNTKTPYEKKKEALRFKLFNDLGLPVSQINSTANVGVFFDTFMQKIKTEQGMALLVKYQQDLKNAEVLNNKLELEKYRERELSSNSSDIVMISAAGDGPKQAITVADDENVFNFVSMETPPTYPGGIDKFYQFINDNMKYPEKAKESNIQGSVFVSFIIEKDGSLTNLKVARKLGYGTDEEAIRILKLSRRWNPGMQYGKPVRVKHNIAVKFNLP